MDVLSKIIEDYSKFHDVFMDKKYLPYIIKLCKDKITNRKFPDKAIDLMDEAMCLAKIRDAKVAKVSHIDEALKNISGVGMGVLEYEFSYSELEPFFLDHYLGVVSRKNLLNINYVGNDCNLETLLDEIRKGFGVSKEAILNLDLSNFTENNSLSLLIGTSPGYVGYEDGGILSEHFAKFIYQVIVVKNFESAAGDVRQFLLSIINNGVFFDRKGREFKTNNTIFVFINQERSENSFGFISKTKKQSTLSFDLTLNSKKNTNDINPYVDSFKYRGYDISFDESDFHQNSSHYKKALLELIRKYNKGKYFLFFNSEKGKIEILNK